jgi:hypothetical protein
MIVLVNLVILRPASSALLEPRSKSYNPIYLCESAIFMQSQCSIRLAPIEDDRGMSLHMTFEVKMIHHHTRWAVLAASHEIGDCFNTICATTIFTCRFQLGSRSLCKA